MNSFQEHRLYAPTFRAMQRWGWIDERALVAFEVSLVGRRIDAMVLTISGVLMALEFKVSDTAALSRQGVANQLIAHRSFVITSLEVSEKSRAHIAERGVGLLVVKGDVVRKVNPASYQAIDPVLKSRVSALVAARGQKVADLVFG